MIVAVKKLNENEWANFCHKLWPDTEAEEFISERKKGSLPYEYLYYEGRKPVGFISLSLRHDYVEGTTSSPVAYLEGIYVEPEYRGKQIGTELIRFAKNWAKEHGCRELASDCELENVASSRFHEKCGFKEVNRIICYVMKVDE